MQNHQNWIVEIDWEFFFFCSSLSLNLMIAKSSVWYEHQIITSSAEELSLFVQIGGKDIMNEHIFCMYEHQITTSLVLSLLFR